MQSERTTQRLLLVPLRCSPIDSTLTLYRLHSMSTTVRVGVGAFIFRDNTFVTGHRKGSHGAGASRRGLS